MAELLLTVGVQCLIAVLLDLYFGNMTHWHPLTGFEKLARFVEAKLFPETAENPKKYLLPGLVAVFFTVLFIAFLVWLLVRISVMGWPMEVIILYFLIGGHSLAVQTHAVSESLLRNDIEQARMKTHSLVGQKCTDFTPDQLVYATIESVLGKGNKSVLGVLFWFAIAGAPGAVVYRLINILGTMWSHTHERYRYFGRPVAVLDDLLNWVPVRLTVFTYAIQGTAGDVLTRIDYHASLFQNKSVAAVAAAAVDANSPPEHPEDKKDPEKQSDLENQGNVENQGDVESKVEESSSKDSGTQPTVLDIERAVFLVSTGTWVWVAVIILVSSLIVVATSPVI